MSCENRIDHPMVLRGSRPSNGEGRPFEQERAMAKLRRRRVKVPENLPALSNQLAVNPSSDRPNLSAWRRLVFAVSSVLGILALLELAPLGLWHPTGQCPSRSVRGVHASGFPLPSSSGCHRSGDRHPGAEQARVAQRPALSSAQAARYVPDRLPGGLSHLRPAVL